MQPVFELSSSYKPSTLFSGVLGLSNRYGLQTLTQICAVWVHTGCKGISGPHDAGFVCNLASNIIGGVGRDLLAKQGSRLNFLGKLCGCQDVEAPSSRLNEQQVLSLHAVSSTLSAADVLKALACVILSE